MKLRGLVVVSTQRRHGYVGYDTASSSLQLRNCTCMIRSVHISSNLNSTISSSMTLRNPSSALMYNGVVAPSLSSSSYSSSSLSHMTNSLSPPLTPPSLEAATADIAIPSIASPRPRVTPAQALQAFADSVAVTKGEVSLELLERTLLDLRIGVVHAAYKRETLATTRSTITGTIATTDINKVRNSPTNSIRNSKTSSTTPYHRVPDVMKQFEHDYRWIGYLESALLLLQGGRRGGGSSKSNSSSRGVGMVVEKMTTVDSSSSVGEIDTHRSTTLHHDNKGNKGGTVRNIPASSDDSTTSDDDNNMSRWINIALDLIPFTTTTITKVTSSASSSSIHEQHIIGQLPLSSTTSIDRVPLDILHAVFQRRKRVAEIRSAETVAPTNGHNTKYSFLRLLPPTKRDIISLEALYRALKFISTTCHDNVNGSSSMMMMSNNNQQLSNSSIIANSSSNNSSSGNIGTSVIPVPAEILRLLLLESDLLPNAFLDAVRSVQYELDTLNSSHFTRDKTTSVSNQNASMQIKTLVGNIKLISSILTAIETLPQQQQQHLQQLQPSPLHLNDTSNNNTNSRNSHQNIHRTPHYSSQSTTSSKSSWFTQSMLTSTLQFITEGFQALTTATKLARSGNNSTSLSFTNTNNSSNNNTNVTSLTTTTIPDPTDVDALQLTNDRKQEAFSSLLSLTIKVTDLASRLHNSTNSSSNNNSNIKSGGGQGFGSKNKVDSFAPLDDPHHYHYHSALTYAFAHPVLTSATGVDTNETLHSIGIPVVNAMTLWNFMEVLLSSEPAIKGSGKEDKGGGGGGEEEGKERTLGSNSTRSQQLPPAIITKPVLIQISKLMSAVPLSSWNPQLVFRFADAIQAIVTKTGKSKNVGGGGTSSRSDSTSSSIMPTDIPLPYLHTLRTATLHMIRQGPQSLSGRLFTPLGIVTIINTLRTSRVLDREFLTILLDHIIHDNGLHSHRHHHQKQQQQQKQHQQNRSFSAPPETKPTGPLAELSPVQIATLVHAMTSCALRHQGFIRALVEHASPHVFKPIYAPATPRTIHKANGKNRKDTTVTTGTSTMINEPFLAGPLLTFLWSLAIGGHLQNCPAAYVSQLLAFLPASVHAYAGPTTNNTDAYNISTIEDSLSEDAPSSSASSASPHSLMGRTTNEVNSPYRDSSSPRDIIHHHHQHKQRLMMLHFTRVLIEAYNSNEKKHTSNHILLPPFLQPSSTLACIAADTARDYELDIGAWKRHQLQKYTRNQIEDIVYSRILFPHSDDDASRREGGIQVGSLYKSENEKETLFAGTAVDSSFASSPSSSHIPYLHQLPYRARLALELYASALRVAKEYNLPKPQFLSAIHNSTRFVFDIFFPPVSAGGEEGRRRTQATSETSSFPSSKLLTNIDGGTAILLFQAPWFLPQDVNDIAREAMSEIHHLQGKPVGSKLAAATTASSTSSASSSSRRHPSTPSMSNWWWSSTPALSLQASSFYHPSAISRVYALKQLEPSLRIILARHTLPVELNTMRNGDMFGVVVGDSNRDKTKKEQQTKKKNSEEVERGERKQISLEEASIIEIAPSRKVLDDWLVDQLLLSSPPPATVTEDEEEEEGNTPQSSLSVGDVIRGLSRVKTEVK